MAKLTSLLVLLSVVSATLGAVGIGRATVHESHPDQCFSEKTNSYYSPGESWQLEGCGQATCEKFSRSSSSLMISYESCGVVAVAPPCYLVQDNTKPYPACCNQVVCPESNDDELFASAEELDEEELNAPTRNNTSFEEGSSDNSLSGTAVHFSLSRPMNYMNDISRDVNNELNSLEEDKPSEEESFEIIQPRELPPTFQYAVFDDNIDHEQFNELDAQKGDFQLV